MGNLADLFSVACTGSKMDELKQSISVSVNHRPSGFLSGVYLPQVTVGLAEFRVCTSRTYCRGTFSHEPWKALHDFGDAGL